MIKNLSDPLIFTLSLAEFFHKIGHSKVEVIFMAYIDPKIRSRFDSLPIDLKDEIMKREVKLYTLNDLMRCLQNIVDGK